MNFLCKVSFIQTIASGINPCCCVVPFLLIVDEYFFCEYSTACYLFSLIDRHLRFSLLRAIINKAAPNILELVFLQTHIFLLGRYLEVRLLKTG